MKLFIIDFGDVAKVLFNARKNVRRSIEIQNIRLNQRDVDTAQIVRDPPTERTDPFPVAAERACCRCHPTRLRGHGRVYCLAYLAEIVTAFHVSLSVIAAALVA